MNTLNEQQRIAVEYCDGPSLVIAGAGSGKTRVLTYKIMHLLNCGLPPETILALTFTNKAAKEMRDRIMQMVGYQTAKRLWMGTFHSIFGRILRNEAEKIGFTPDFTIYDTEDSKRALKSIIKEMMLDDKIYKTNLVLYKISEAKNNLITAQSYAQNKIYTSQDYYNHTPMISEIYRRYAIYCKRNNAMDFDDMLLYTNILFRDFPDVLTKYQNTFGYILVDEYQDTNFAQYLIINQLGATHKRVCVVGDDAQSIYSFRGANIKNILNFQKTYPEGKIFKLERNYRSTKNIVNAANSLIEKNHNQHKKICFSENEDGEKITISQLFSDYDESYAVASNIEQLIRKQDEQVNYADIAILYRTNAQSRVLEESLRKRMIPYKVYGGTSFYQRKEIKDALAYFRLTINHKDEESLKRIINVPARGIGETTLKKLISCATNHNCNTWNIIENLEDFDLNISKKTKENLINFRELFINNRKQLFEIDAYTLANNIIRSSGLKTETLRDNTQENISKRENLDELLKAIHAFCETQQQETGTQPFLSDFMQDVALLTDQDIEDEKSKNDPNKVTMMTIHASKGLEFDYVFIVGLEENLFPSSMMQSENDLEEERRLMYVALTRAKKGCAITYVKQRFRNGHMEFSNPSRFIQDIDSQYVKTTNIVSPISNLNSNNFSSKSIHNFLENNHLTKITHKKGEQCQELGEFAVGKRVKHTIFGFGTIQSIEDLGNDSHLRIQFDNVGLKTLLSKYAKLEVID